ncbi:uncharacterized protein LOC129962162 [Argiope bruennichi]|uniref:uncharacterized protein LOC129962162 n=1 Tax=Argiope bruennichi TaxID=94029 RepID=UPI0024947308|nr:uncharacterized protein LOC129962162 [Argiope bruennichi]
MSGRRHQIDILFKAAGPLSQSGQSLTFLLIFSFIYLLVKQGFVFGYRAHPAWRTRDVRNCYSDMMKENDITHLLLETISAEDIDAFCRRITKLKKCVADGEHQLSIRENTDCLQKTRGITVFYLNICPPGSNITEKYKENSHCFNTIEKQVVSCSSFLPDAIEYRMQRNLRKICCGLKRHRVCLSEAAYYRCGKEAADVTEQILQRYFQSQLTKCENNHLPPCEHLEFEGDVEQHSDLDKHHIESELWNYHSEERKRHKSEGSFIRTSIYSIIVCLGFVLFDIIF